MFCDPTTDALLTDGLLSQTRLPRLCLLCEVRMDCVEDYDWHGYGNCVEITDELWAAWEREQ